jgi:type III secretory pathway component EscS
MTKQLRDQALHCAAAALCLLPVALAPNLLTGAISGFLVGMVREITEEREVSLAALKAALGSKLDLSFWALGGALAGIIA